MATSIYFKPKHGETTLVGVVHDSVAYDMVEFYQNEAGLSGKVMAYANRRVVGITRPNGTRVIFAKRHGSYQA